ncbi:MAG: spore cortex biosynthesis protein YabQ [Firmicutes bacterium]|nr:spore cortex biosynthesis protein YabQ [Bacillota bacterium]
MPGLYDPPYIAVALGSIILGAFFGLIYDIFRIRRIAAAPSSPRKGGKLSPEAVLIFFEDIVFSIFASVAFILFTYVMSRGIIRAYSVICTGVGFAVYYFTLGRLTAKIAAAATAIIRRIIKSLLAIIMKPLIFAAKRAGKIIRKKRARAYTKKQMRLLLADASNGFAEPFLLKERK